MEITTCHFTSNLTVSKFYLLQIATKNRDRFDFFFFNEIVIVILMFYQSVNVHFVV